MTQPRDTQRKKLYTAERVLQPLAKPLPTVRDVEKYIARVLSRQSILRKYPNLNPNVAVKDGRGRRIACAHGSSAISIPRWARNEWVVLHELAHTIADRKHDNTTIPWHGWQYAAIFLDLVKSMMGKDAHDQLRASFKAHKVRYTEPRKREMTPEQKDALRARLAAMRAAKQEAE